MSQSLKNQAEILAKLNISALNEMQLEAIKTIRDQHSTILLSPTGTGKTLAFLLPIVDALDEQLTTTQVMIVAPSRELAMQIEQVARDMGAGYKVNVVYGGRSISKDRIEIAQAPAIIIGTPGRLLDHLHKKTIVGEHIKTLVLDEFDKSLEIGFEQEMKELMYMLPNLEKRVLTSATQEIEVPSYVRLRDAITLDYLNDTNSGLTVKAIISPDKDKLATLAAAIRHLGAVPGIVFCNFKDSIDRISQYLESEGISHGCFYGGMEQKDRERVLIKFRNGSHQVLLATDLAARGIDVPDLKYIIHYHLPTREAEFIHRNGRTARMNKDGIAYVLHWQGEELPEFIPTLEEEILTNTGPVPPSDWYTLFISGGRRDKISKGDIAGLFFKKGGLEKGQLGIIELKNDCSFVAVQHDQIEKLISLVTDQRLKKKKVRIYSI